MADKYPNLSPYAYCAWNPVKLVDPDGNEALDDVDWYKSRHGDNYIWREGHAMSVNVNDEVYDNVGESHSIPLRDGNYLNCFQNCIVSRGEKKDVTWDAYHNDDVRADLICNESPLPLSHKKELFSNNIRTRGFVIPDMIGFQLSGNAVVGGGYTMDVTLGYIKNSGLFMSVSPGAGSGFDLSCGIGFCVGMCSSNIPSKSNIIGPSFSLSAGFGGVYYQHNVSVQKQNRWIVSTFGYSVGSKTFFGGSAGVSYSF